MLIRLRVTAMLYRTMALLISLLWLLSAAVMLAHAAETTAETALDRYVRKPDKAYRWTLVETVPGDGFTTYLVDMTSQSWRNTADVDCTNWTHRLVIVKPEKARAGTAMLFIGGGSNRDRPPRQAGEEIKVLALGTNSVVAHLATVPNQPLAFCGDGKPRFEDDLIAYTWDKFLTTGDETWIAQLPMTKSAVRAMDTVQAFLAGPDGGRLKIEQFVVTGASKRGWTTWLTAAVDRRVVAIIPIVIDVLNVRPSMKHHHAAYGFWAPAIGDYVRHRIPQRMDTPECGALLKIVDPYAYRRRLTLPKYVVNATGDQFFLPDSSQFYFGDLPGEKHLRYVPNTDHSLKGSDALQSILAFYRAFLGGTPRPSFSWRLASDGSIHVTTKNKPRSVNLWQATAVESRDFRLETIGPALKSSPLEDQGGANYVAKVPPPAKGWTAFFVELVYPSGGREPFKFTTSVYVVPDVLPHKDMPLGDEVGGE
jgi:PhoPQ-activated pathogenicity-related protein